MTQYIKVGKAEELGEGKAKVAQVDGLRIALFRVGGRFYALEASCPHEGGPLAEGTVEGVHVVCPWHGYDYNLKTGECGQDPDLHVLTYPVKVEAGDLLIEMP